MSNNGSVRNRTIRLAPGELAELEGGLVTAEGKLRNNDVINKTILGDSLKVHRLSSQQSCRPAICRPTLQRQQEFRCCIIPANGR